MNKKQKKINRKHKFKMWIAYYESRYMAERQKVAGYEQVAQVQSAYISILLNKLGATEDNAIAITAPEVAEALKKYEARAKQTEEGYSLYCEVVE